MLEWRIVQQEELLKAELKTNSEFHKQVRAVCVLVCVCVVIASLTHVTHTHTHHQIEQQKKKYEQLRRKKETISGILPPLVMQQTLFQKQLEEIKVKLVRNDVRLNDLQQEEDLAIRLVCTVCVYSVQCVCVCVCVMCTIVLAYDCVRTVLTTLSFTHKQPAEPRTRDEGVAHDGVALRW